MGSNEETVIGTKVSILVQDFQRFRKEQREVNKSLGEHSEEESKVQAEILTTLKWHTIIGSFMVGVLMYILYKILEA